MKNHEKLFLLAQGLVEGKTIENSMLDAGYSKSYANGRTVSIEKGGKSRKISPMKHPQVIEYMDEIKDEVIRTMQVRKDESIQKSVIVVRDIVDKLEFAFQIAAMNREPNAMVAAAMATAKMLGLIPDGSQTLSRASRT